MQLHALLFFTMFELWALAYLILGDIVEHVQQIAGRIFRYFLVGFTDKDGEYYVYKFFHSMRETSIFIKINI